MVEAWWREVADKEEMVTRVKKKLMVENVEQRVAQRRTIWNMRVMCFEIHYGMQWCFIGQTPGANEVSSLNIRYLFVISTLRSQKKYSV